MTEFKWTEQPLPEGYDSWVVETEYRGGTVAVAGFLYDPQDRLKEDPNSAVVIGSGNTYGTVPYSKYPLQVAAELHKQTNGLPQVGIETLGAHGPGGNNFTWMDGYPQREFAREQVHRGVMLAAAENMNLFGRPLHHEGHSQAAIQPIHRTAATGARGWYGKAIEPQSYGLEHKTLTVFDPAGMRHFNPKFLALGRFWQRTMRHAPPSVDFDFEPGIQEYCAAHPELEKFLPKHIDRKFTIERIGARPVAASLLIKSLVQNPEMECVYVSCENGNGVFSTNGSTRRYQERLKRWESEERHILDRLHMVAPEGLPHQLADVPFWRASLVAAHILGGPQKAIEVVENWAQAA